MTWIKTLLSKNFGVEPLYKRIDSHQKLVLILAVPCFVIIAVSLIAANTSPYLIAFVLIVLLLLMSFVFVATKQSSEYQIRTLSNLIESMIDGDYTLRGRVKTNQAFQELLKLINNLSETLARHKIEAKESRLLLETIMEQMDAMVFATNEHGKVVMANASAEKLIFAELDEAASTDLASIDVGREIINAESGIIELKQKQLTGEYFLFKEKFLSEGLPHQLYMLTNAERLLMEKERKAWQSLFRVLSHELNNSLAPIAAISQTMQKKLGTSDKEVNIESLLDGVNIINERAESLSNFIASYSQLSHLAKPNLSLVSLVELITPMRALYPQIDIDISPTCAVNINVDKAQIEQVLINLFKNSVEAMEQSETKSIEVSSYQEGQWQQIKIVDSGKGIANVDNLFVPFYTTKSQGSGIGLALSRQIMFNHNGLIKIENNKDKLGTKVLLSLSVCS